MKIIAGNWKFNKELRDLAKAINFVEALEDKLNGIENVEVHPVKSPVKLPAAGFNRGISPKAKLFNGVKIFPHDFILPQLAKKVRTIKIGSQDIHWEEDGSFTGAHFSAKDLISLGIKETLIGHSETRFYFGVNDEKVALKLKSTFENGIFSTICIGEDIEEKEKGETENVLREQIEKGILPAFAPRASAGKPAPKDVNLSNQFLLAYEPLYAIAGFARLRGKEPKPAKIEDIKRSHQTIREIFSQNGYPKIKILYGGSSNPENAKELLSQPFIDGLLVGTASWNLDSFFEIIKIAKEIEK